MVSRLPDFSGDIGLLIDGIGETFHLHTVDGLEVDFYGFYLPYMRNGQTVNKRGRVESDHDRILVQFNSECPKFNSGDTITNSYGKRFTISNEPQVHNGAIWLEVDNTRVMNVGNRGMFDAS